MLIEDYNRINNTDLITDDDMKNYPRIHFCPEWDYLLIDASFPEFECCICYK
jgi:hypothetical protein